MNTNEKWMKLLEQQFAALTALRSADLPIPHLILFYTTIDIFAYIWGEGEDLKIGKKFCAFCDKYLIRHLPEFNSDDLWGARCAILHTASPESDLSKRGKARKLFYSWGSAGVGINKQVIEKTDVPEKYLAVSLESLENALCEALTSLVEDLSKSPCWAAKSIERLNDVYATIPFPKNIR